MNGKFIYKTFFIFFVYPLQGPSLVGKLTLKKISFYLYIYTPKLGGAIILKGFFVFMTHPTEQLIKLKCIQMKNKAVNLKYGWIVILRE